jgi:hypothetical protein
MAVRALAASAHTPGTSSFEVASVKPAAPNGLDAAMTVLKGSAEEQRRFRGSEEINAAMQRSVPASLETRMAAMRRGEYLYHWVTEWQGCPGGPGSVES